MGKKFAFIALSILLSWQLPLPVAGKSHLEQANEYAEQSELFFQKAIEEYKKALQEPAPEKKKVHFLLGRLYYQKGKYQEAIRELLPLYEGERTDFSVAKILALSYFMQGDYTEALAIFDRFGDAHDDEFLFFYGQTCEKQNLYEQAVRIYGKIKDEQYKSLALGRIRTIDARIEEKSLHQIKDKFIRNLIKNAPGEKEYPNAGAIILLEDQRLEILEDFTAREQVHVLIKILNDRGKKFGEVELDYDSTYEKVELEYARTIRPDGVIVFAGDKHIRDVSRYLNYPLYSNARVKIISLPEVTEGAVIEYKATWTIKKLINKKDFARHYGVQGYEPYLIQRLSVAVPKNYQFNFKCYSGKTNYKTNFKHKVKEEHNKRTFVWEFKNAPEIIEEPSMPPWEEIVPHIALSSFNSWEDIYQWWRDLARDKAVADRDIERKVGELIRGKKSLEDKAKAIYHWVASKVRYVAVEYGQAGFEPHPATEIFKNKYGDCKDQAMLLIAMLHRAGIPAYPVLIGTKGCWVLDEQFPILTFNHAIVLAEVEGKRVFLDPTAETASFGDLPPSDQGRKVLVFYENKGEIEETPLAPSVRNRVSRTMLLKIRRDETVFGIREIRTFGVYDQSQRAWLKYTKPALVREQLKQKISTITPGGELVKYEISEIDDLSRPVSIKMEFKGPEYLTRAGKNRIIPKLGNLDATLVTRERRTFPIDFQVLSQEETEITVELPEHLRVKFLPEAITKDTPWFSYRCSYDRVRNLVVFKEMMIRKKKEVSVDEYKRFKQVYEELVRQSDKQVILEEVSE